jgi:hypothetical protein
LKDLDKRLWEGKIKKKEEKMMNKTKKYYDTLYSSFELHFDNCTAGLREEDWENRVSICYDMCLIRCHFNWIP